MANNQVEQTLQLYEIYGVWHVPFWQQIWFIVFTSLLACFVCAGIIYLLFKRYRKNAKPLSDWQIALRQLDMLKNNNMLAPAMSERYYVYLTSLLKEYISARYAHDVHSLTDEEMVTYIEQLPLYTHYKEQLIKIFSAGLSIKFAHQYAVEQQMLQDWQHAYEFVIGTKNEALDGNLKVVVSRKILPKPKGDGQ